MKKHLISLILSSLLICSCSEVTTSPFDDSKDSSTELSSEITTPESSAESSKTKEDSISIDTSSVSSSSTEQAATWREDSIDSMKKYQKGFDLIPFPNGFSSNYIDSSGADQDGDSFYVYDFIKEDISSSYEKQLIEAGFQKGYIDDEFKGIAYWILNPGTNDVIYIQGELVYPNTNYSRYDIFAWYEVGAPKKETFPYEEINSFFGVSNISKENLPSFQLSSGEKYGYYSSNTFYYVGGNFSNQTSDVDFTSSYESSLSKAGYEAKDGTAINSSIGLKAEYMATQGYFLLQLSKLALSN